MGVYSYVLIAAGAAYMCGASRKKVPEDSNRLVSAAPPVADFLNFAIATPLLYRVVSDIKYAIWDFGWIVPRSVRGANLLSSVFFALSVVVSAGFAMKLKASKRTKSLAMMN